MGECDGAIRERRMGQAKGRAVPSAGGGSKGSLRRLGLSRGGKDDRLMLLSAGAAKAKAWVELS